MKRFIFSYYALFWMIILTSCGNDGVYNEETNREAVKRKKQIKDSLRKAEMKIKDSVVNLQK
jgi:hypothetical protein